MHIGPTPRAWKCSAGSWTGLDPSGAAHCDVPVGVSCALDRTASRDRARRSTGWGSVKSAAMIDRVVGNKPLPADIRQDIIERTDGIPLFVEEMTKAVLEAGSEGAASRTAATIPSPTLAVPASLQASLMARLDRLGQLRKSPRSGRPLDESSRTPS